MVREAGALEVWTKPLERQVHRGTRGPLEPQLFPLVKAGFLWVHNSEVA